MELRRRTRALVAGGLVAVAVAAGFAVSQLAGDDAETAGLDTADPVNEATLRMVPGVGRTPDQFVAATEELTRSEHVLRAPTPVGILDLFLYDIKSGDGTASTCTAVAGAAVTGSTCGPASTEAHLGLVRGVYQTDDHTVFTLHADGAERFVIDGLSVPLIPLRGWAVVAVPTDVACHNMTVTATVGTSKETEEANARCFES